MNQIKSSSICNFIFSSVTFYVIMVTTFNVICYASYKFKKSPHYNSGNKVRGHSTTTWTNFDPILTPSPPRVDKRGHVDKRDKKASPPPLNIQLSSI